MKVSRTIQNKMHRIASLSRKMAKLSSEVDAYFESKGYDIEELRSGNGVPLEELEYGNDITDEFVAYMLIGKCEYCRGTPRECW